VAVHTAGHTHAVLVGGAAFHFADALFGVLHAHAVLAVFFELDLFEADGQQAVEGIQCLFAVILAGEIEDNATVCRRFRALHRDVVFRGGRGREVNEFGRFAGKEFVTIDLQQEGDAAAQVETEVDRGKAEVLQLLGIIDELRLNEELFGGASENGEPANSPSPSGEELQRLRDKGLSSRDR